MAEHPEAFDHVGLLVNEPPGPAGLPFISSSDDLHSSFHRSRRPVPAGSLMTFIVSRGSAIASEMFCVFLYYLNSRHRRAVALSTGIRSLQPRAVMRVREGNDGGLARARCERDVDSQDGDIIFSTRGIAPTLDFPHHGSDALLE